MAKYGGGGFGGGNMQAMIRQAQKMQEDMQKAQESLKEMEFVGEGGGMVKVTISGEKTVLDININKEVIDPEDPEMLEDLILAAFEDAYDKCDAKTEEVMGPFASMLKGVGF